MTAAVTCLVTFSTLQPLVMVESSSQRVPGQVGVDIAWGHDQDTHPGVGQLPAQTVREGL